VPPEIVITPFAQADAPRVRALFVTVNRLLAPAHLADAFERYIALSLREEVDRIADYYAGRDGGFWVARDGATIVGMFGLEAAPRGAMELRRMYVDPAARRRGIARAMLRFAEDECRRRGAGALELSTSELQSEALALYRHAGYRLVREAIAPDASHKTLSGGLKRFYFEKTLG
jgi:putative acetyltransferase